MNKVKRQHYVWRNYLKPWSKQEQIFCAREHKIFSANLMNVAQQNNFYTEETITKEDEVVIRKLILDNIHNPQMKQNAEEWIAFAKVPNEMLSFAKTNFPDEKNLIEDLEISNHNFGENLQGKIENEGIPFLKMLLDENMTFFENEENRHSFGLYLGFQYFRTRQMLEKFIYDPEGKIKITNMPRIWPVVRNIFSSNVGWSLVCDPNKLRLVYLKNATELKFLTSDQPVINTFADYKVLKSVDQFEFYYPISPTQAILLTEKSIYEKYQVVQLENIDDISNLNSKIINASFEQVFSDSIENLQLYFRNSLLK